MFSISFCFGLLQMNRPSLQTRHGSHDRLQASLIILNHCKFMRKKEYPSATNWTSHFTKCQQVLISSCANEWMVEMSEWNP